MSDRSVRVDPSLLDGPIMDRGGVLYVRLLVKPRPTATVLEVFNLSLTDTTGKPRRERVAVAIFYDGSIVVAASFFLRLTLRYRSVEKASVQVLYEPALRRARIRFAAEKGSIEVGSELRGPEVGRTAEYADFLEAPPDEQSEVAVDKTGRLTLPPALEFPWEPGGAEEP
jgi:hypothetical protein